MRTLIPMPNAFATRGLGRAGAAGALVALMLVGWPAAGQAATDFLADAKALSDKGDLKGAQIQLRNAVRNAPENGEAHANLARIDLTLGDLVAAEKEARAARDLGFDPHGTIQLLTETYFAQGKADAVLKDFAVTGKDAATDSAVLIARGFALATQRKLEDAQVAFAEAQRLQPRASEPLLAQGRLAMLRGDAAAATEKTDEALALDPKSFEGRVQKAQLLRAAKNEASAVAVLDGVVAERPSLISARIDRATALIAMNQDDKAGADLKVVLAALPGSVMANFLQADLRLRAKDYSGADALLTKLGDRLGAIPRGYMLQAVVKQQLGQMEQAEDAARRAVARQPDDLDVLKLLGRLELARREPDKVIETLGPVAKTPRADAEVQDLLGAAYAATGDGPDSIASIKKAAALQPDNPGLLAQLGRVQSNAGDVEGAIESYTRALEVSPKQPQIAELLYFASLATGDLDRTAAAVKLARDKLGPDSPEAGNLEGLLKLARVDPEGARSSFAGVLQAHPDFIPARINMARVEGIEGRPAEMLKSLNAVLAGNPASEPALTMVVTQLQQQGKTEDAEAVLARAHAAAPADARITARFAGFELQRNNPKKALGLIGEQKSDAPSSVQTLAVLAAALIADGQKDQARETLTKLLVQDPSQADQRRRLAALLLEAGEAESARNVVQAGLSLTPQNLPLLEEFVAIDARTKGVAAGLETAARLQAQAQDFPAARALKGDLLLAEKRYDDAAAAYREAQAAAPSSMFALRIAQAEQGGGHAPDAVKTLRDWAASHPSDEAVAEMLGQFYIAQHDYKNAASALQSAVDSSPRNALALNNLAWVYQQLGDKRARGLARRAYTLLPGAQTADTLGWILTVEGDSASGVTLLRQAAGDAANDPRLQYHLAVALKDTGKRDEAKQVLRTLVDKKQEFDEMGAAQRLLEELSKA